MLTDNRIMKKVVAVVVTYNRINILKKCLSAIERQTYGCDIIVIDNASTDNKAEWMRSYTDNKQNIQYFNTGNNIGGAGGFNYGMRKAVESGYEYVWIMDDDCIPNADSLEKLMDADEILLSSADYGFLSSKVLWTDGSMCLMNRQKFKKEAEYNDVSKNKGLKSITQATFVSLLFPASTIVKAGLPIKEFFIWGDDIEYTRRISVRMDMPSFLVEDSTVVHEMSVNTGSNIATDVPERIDRYKYAFRNENYLYRKEGIKGFIYYIAKCIFNLCRILIKSKNYRLKRCVIILSCMFKGLWFNPKIEKV